MARGQTYKGVGGEVEEANLHLSRYFIVLPKRRTLTNIQVQELRCGHQLGLTVREVFFSFAK